MSARVLIVEDEMLVAVNLEATIADLGYQPVGIAPDRATALSLAEASPDIALVDLNLRDGPTGPEIGQELSRKGISVLYVTANPRMLGPGVPGTLGVMSKPVDEDAISAALAFALNRRNGGTPTPPPTVTPFD